MLGLLLCLCLLAGCGAPTPELRLPGPPANGCVLDVAGVLSGETTEHILAQNQTLRAATGASLTVVTLDVLKDREIADYATGLFDAWGLDDGARKNGLLLLLAVEEQEYYLLQGTGIGDHLTDETLHDYAWSYLERDFAAGDYDAGVRKVFDALYRWYEDYYAIGPDAAQDAEADPPRSEGKGGGVSWWLVAVLAAGVLAVAVLVVGKLRRSGARHRRSTGSRRGLFAGNYHGRRKRR